MHARFTSLLALTLWCAATVSIHAQPIDSFRYADAASAGKNWRSISDAPPPRPAPQGGLVFSLPFSTDRDRVYWDRDGEWNFTGATGFELEVSCPQPQAMRSLAIYFRSGTGWYIWSQPLSAAGRQKITLQKGQFTAEGNPAGWNKIDKIRISPWKGQPINTELTVHNLTARRENLYLIQATASAPNATERSVAQRTTERLSRWLKQNGIPHAVATEDQLEKIAGSASLIVLPYNTKVPAAGIKALRSFVQRDGKLMVFYSSDDQLAQLMDVKLGATTNTRDIARWRGMAFDDNAPAGVPERVHQQSWNIGLATPASKNGRVLARWINAAGRKSSDPAVIATPRGYWFTHILLDDDNREKQRMLTGLLANLEPALWKDAADHALLNAGRIDGWSSASQTISALNVLAERHPNQDTILAFTRRAGIHQRNLHELYEKGRYREATLKGYELTDQLIRAYALAQSPVTPEFRGVWDHDGTGWYPGDWDRTAKLMADSGINAIFINATWAGLAHYPSKLLPQSFTYRYYGDQLEQCIKAARKYGIEVHAWIVCWYLENSPAEFTAPLRKGDRLQHGSKGNERLWMNPAHPANTRHHIDVITEILTNYDVDGIHLDYIRYPDSDGCFSPYTRQKFERDAGIKVTRWPQDVQSGGVHRERFVSWRAGNITAFVKQARAATGKIKPGAKLSAAVWGGYPQIVSSIGQDWGAWMKDGLLDFVTPMNYAQDLYRFTALLDQQILLPGTRGKIYPGLGVTANESQLRGDQVVEQILALRQRKAGGFALFDLSQTVVDDTLPTLRMGVTRP